MIGQGKTRFFILLGSLLAAVAIGFYSPAENDQAPQKQTVSQVETMPETEASALDVAEAEVYEPLWHYMEENDLAGAAAFMSKHADIIRMLLTDTLRGERWLYNEEGLTAVIEGRGLVLTGASILFYGNFNDGMPYGHVLALQEMTLEQPRYDYAIGSWEGGEMNGAGIVGYTYYENTQSLDGLKTEKAGFFTNNLMEGEVRYTSIDGTGDSRTWLIQAEAGKTVLDERWNYEKEKAEHYLLSENDDSHAYSVKETDREIQLWRNRIEW